MLNMPLIFLINFLIAMFLMLLNSIISIKTFQDREKLSPFECGFDPKNSARLPFSLHFFLITVIFLIFDIEITLLLPLISSIYYSNMMNFSIIALLFILILILGLIHEWKQGALNWMN